MKWQWIKHLAIVIILLGAGALIWFYKFVSDPEMLPAHQAPEILKIQKYQAAVAWISEKPGKGKINYMLSGSNSPPLSACETHAGTTKHEIVISGLEPSSRYTYWIEGSEKQYQFQTQPLPSSPFSFLMVFGDVSGRIVDLMMLELPEFIVSLTPVAEKRSGGFSKVRPFVPVYGPFGTDSPFLKAIGEKPDLRENWKIDWGGFRLIFIYQPSVDPDLLDAPAAHTLGIISTDEIFREFRPGAPEKPGIRSNNLHADFAAHNKKYSASPVAFVGVIGKHGEMTEADGIRYFGIPALKDRQKNSGSIRIDVDVDSARAMFTDEGKEAVLRSPPVKQAITCGECRRLADKGAYEESVKAYESFIEHNMGHYQIDDACYAIAEILDEKLFRFQNALQWYERLIKDYPKSSLAPLARQRIQYISEYSDYDFKPLARFDRIKKIEFSRKKHQKQDRDKLLNEVGSIISEYPDSRLAPVMQYWIANQYRNTDPDRAINAYMKLKHDWPEHPDAEEVLIEIGETYYQAGRYDESLETYKKAAMALPALEKSISAQIRRCHRNMHRQKIRLACWIIIIALMAIAARKHAVRKRMMLISLVWVFILGLALSFFAWIIHEQFSSFKEMMWIIASFTGITFFSAVISISLSERYFIRAGHKNGIRKFLMPVYGIISGIIWFSAGIYLAVYYINVHFLVIIHL